LSRRSLLVEEADEALAGVVVGPGWGRTQPRSRHAVHQRGDIDPPRQPLDLERPVAAADRAAGKRAGDLVLVRDPAIDRAASRSRQHAHLAEQGEQGKGRQDRPQVVTPAETKILVDLGHAALRKFADRNRSCEAGPQTTKAKGRRKFLSLHARAHRASVPDLKFALISGHPRSELQIQRGTLDSLVC